MELGRREGLQERLGEELRGLSSRLGSQEEENSNLVGRLEATLRKLELGEQEKSTLQVTRKTQGSKISKCRVTAICMHVCMYYFIKYEV